MYKFIITLQLRPGARDEIARASEVQAATRAEAGCIAYDFFTCTDDPERLVFVEAWASNQAHEARLTEEYTRSFTAFHEPRQRAFSFETTNVEP